MTKAAAKNTMTETTARGDFFAKAASDHSLAVGAALVGDKAATGLAIALAVHAGNKAKKKNAALVPTITAATIKDGAKTLGYDSATAKALSECLGKGKQASYRVRVFLFVVDQPEAARDLGAYSEATLEKLGGKVAATRITRSKDKDDAVRETAASYSVADAVEDIKKELAEKVKVAQENAKGAEWGKAGFLSQGDARTFKDLNGKNPPKASTAENAKAELLAIAKATVKKPEDKKPEDKKPAATSTAPAATAPQGTGGQTDGAEGQRLAALASIANDLLEGMLADATLTEAGLLIPFAKAGQQRAAMVARINKAFSFK